MNSLAWLSVVVWACASGCGSTSTPSTQPIGFTFNTAEGTFASFGWSGAVHDVTAPPETPFDVKTTECDNDVCRFAGPVDTGAKVNRRRCKSRMSQTCTTDNDCPMDDDLPRCVYIYDTPLATPLPSGNNNIGACGWTYIPFTNPDGTPTITGTLNLSTGALNLESFTVLLPLNATGPGTFAGVCAECVGDKMANDGVKDGHCQVATQLGPSPDSEGRIPIADPDVVDRGMPCDVNRTGTLGNYGGSYSMDCSPTVVSGLGPPLQFGGSFSSSGVQVSLSAASPDCTAPGFTDKKCFCGMCTDGQTACMSKADCGAGQSCIGASRPTALTSTDNVPAASNLCDKGICNWNAQEGTGKCSPPGMPDVTIGCYPAPASGSKGADGTDLTISGAGLGVPDPQVPTLYHANTAGASCIAAGSTPQSVPVARQLGLPGLLFQKRNFQISVKYAEDQK